MPTFLFKTKKYTLSILVIISVLVYTLFALKRIKFSLVPEFDGMALNNEVWLFPVLLLFKQMLNKKRTSLQIIRTYDNKLIFLIFGLIFVSLLGSFKMQEGYQYIYALLQFIGPLLFLFSINVRDLNYLELLIKFIVAFSLIYSLLAIVASLNYGFFMQLLGNDTNYQYYSQYRASLMLGSSITVSYYLNLTIPMCFYLFFSVKEKIWRIVASISIVLNLFATAILLSRLAFMISILIVIFYLLFVKNNNFTPLKKFSLLIIISSVGFYLLKSIDLSRLFMGFSDKSTSMRFETMNLGLYLFEKNPLIGTGLGRYFLRIYSNREVSVDGLSGLVDPHNTYIMALSEIGIVGLLLFISIFGLLLRTFKFIKNDVLRKTAYITIIAYLLGALGGSQVFNEISFSTILWIYLALFKAVGVRDFNMSLKQNLR
jgi:O-antigen ligase